MSSEHTERNIKPVMSSEHTRIAHIKRFLASSSNDYSIELNDDKWVTPGCMQGVKLLPREERCSYKPSDIWTNEEHTIFLKYCLEKRQVLPFDGKRHVGKAT